MSDSSGQPPAQQQDAQGNPQDGTQGQTIPPQPPPHPDLSAKLKVVNDRTEARGDLQNGGH